MECNRQNRNKKLYDKRGFMMALIFVVVICSFALLKLLKYFFNIAVVHAYLRQKDTNTVCSSCSMLILIPVIREQSVIGNTLLHFLSMNLKDIELYIAIAGTTRENKQDNVLSTREVVEKSISEQSFEDKNIQDIFFCEADELQGDRATQLNYAVEYFKDKYPLKNLDYIGVYDADSLPSAETLQEVNRIFSKNENIVACQQPVHFVRAANRMAFEGKNPILVANALYQTTWTVIRELPSWIKYAKTSKDELFNENIYLIGHGEFLRLETYQKFKFPEFEITDGIQLGYRLGMSNKKISPLKEFCNDDVPQEIGQLINQHKRWFGGCMNLYGAYKWSHAHFKTKAFVQLLDGYWSQICWAFASLAMIISLFLSVINEYTILSLVLIGIIVVYSYVVPIISHLILSDRIEVRVRDWLTLPLAIALKGIGPNWFMLEKLLKGKVVFKKVER